MDSHANLWLVALLLTILSSRNVQGACGNNELTGPEDVDHNHHHYDNIDTATGRGYLLDDSYKFTCCGVLKIWNFRTQKKGTVFLQVWRDTGSTWKLVGENTQTATNSGNQRYAYSVASADQITVAPGDIIGWYTTGDVRIRYDDKSGTYRHSSTASIINPGVGNTADWDSQTSASDHQYGISAVVDSTANSPSFTNLGATITKSDTDPAGTNIRTVAATDADANAVLTYSMTTSSIYFDFDPNTNKVTMKSKVISGTYSLSFRVEDECLNADTGSLTVTVTNSAPTINSFSPGSANIREDETLETWLVDIDASDASPSDFVECSVQSSSPVSTDSFTKYNSTLSQWQVYSSAFPSFDYRAATSYTLTIACTDGSATDTDTVTISIIENTPPVFNNLPNTTSVAKASAEVGHLVFAVLASDVDNQQLFFNMTTSPASTPFSIFNNGEILTNSLIPETVSTYTLSIFVYDTFTLVGSQTLTVTISDINNAPSITNLPGTATITENSALSKSIFQVTVSDTDVGQTHLYTANFTPESARRYFHVDITSGLVSTSPTNNVNLEALAGATVTVAITASDGTASDTGNLVVTVQNVNEQPTFDKTRYYIDLNEGNAGSDSETPGFVILDQDVGDTHTYGFPASCTAFAINPSSGLVTLSQTYDLDVSGTSTTTSCEVTVADSAYTATTTLSVTMNYMNDNTPVFSSSSYTFYVSNATEVGYIIGSVSATDADLGDHGSFDYSLIQNNASTEYFGVDNNGSIYVKDNISSLENGNSVLMTAVATDGGGLTGNSVVYIYLMHITTLAPTTTTDRYRTFIEDSNNVVWLTCIIALGLCFSTLTIYTAHRLDFIGSVRQSCHNLWQSCRSLSEKCRRSCQSEDLDLTESFDGSNDREMDIESDYQPPRRPPIQRQRLVGNKTSQSWDFWTTGAQL